MSFGGPRQLQEFATFLEHLQPVLERVSYAFAKIILICQGTHGFQSQVRRQSAAAATALLCCATSCTRVLTQLSTLAYRNWNLIKLLLITAGAVRHGAAAGCGTVLWAAPAGVHLHLPGGN